MSEPFLPPQGVRALASPRASRLDQAFYATLYLKAFTGALELIGGSVLLAIGRGHLAGPVRFLTTRVVDRDRDDLIYRSLAHYFHHLTGGTIRFAAIYLIVDAIIKLVLINEVLHRRYWAYIALIVVLSVLVLYQAYRIALGHSVLLVALTIFDLAVIYLSAKEYRRHQPTS